MDGRKVAAGAAAAAVAIGGVKWGDDAARALRPSPYRPPTGVVGGPVIGTGHVGAAQVDSQIETFVVSVADQTAAGREAAREAGRTTACEVTYIAFTEARLPDGAEWIKIATEAVDAALLDVPFGSGAWRALEEVKDEVAQAVSDQFGYVDTVEAESVADELACAWT